MMMMTMMMSMMIAVMSVVASSFRILVQSGSGLFVVGGVVIIRIVVWIGEIMETPDPNWFNCCLKQVKLE